MILLPLVLLAAAPAASAYDRCLNTGEAGNGIQSAMNDCAGQEYRRQDARLNLAYKAKMASLPAPRQQILRGMQRQWILDRDRRCKVKGVYTMASFEAVDCRASETAKRTAWLEKYR